MHAKFIATLFSFAGIKRDHHVPKSLILGVIMGFSMPSSAHGATNVWSTTLGFTEFMGQPGGFDDDSAGRVELHSNANPGPQARSYDVLRAQEVDGATGRTVFGQGQDGIADMTITTRVFNGNQGRWGSLAAEKRLGDYRSSVSIASGGSKSGDFGVVAYEFSFSSALQITADSFNMRLVSANGSGQLYEWAFITLGAVSDAPFTFGQLSGYGATQYSSLGSASFLTPSGQPSGGSATNNQLPHGKSLSQFLTGAAGGSPSGGEVAPGWFALDDFNAVVLDGEELLNVNPGTGTSSLVPNQTIEGSDLGLAGGAGISSFTVWMGYYDVGFDTDGDGFTATRGLQQGAISELTLGNSSDFIAVPEPSLVWMVFGGAVLAFGRRTRKG